MSVALTHAFPDPPSKVSDDLVTVPTPPTPDNASEVTSPVAAPVEAAPAQPLSTASIEYRLCKFSAGIGPEDSGNGPSMPAARRRNLSPNTKEKKLLAKVCANCEAYGDHVNLRACSRCKLVDYCSRPCQAQHWTQGFHKRFCITPEERLVSLAIQKAEPPALECTICRHPMALHSSSFLPCSHSFHAQCIQDLRSFADAKVCPVCREPLPPPPEVLYEEAREAQLAIAKPKDIPANQEGGAAALADDLAPAVRALRSAAGQGHVQAQFELGSMYKRGGPGVTRNSGISMRWFRRAAEQGHALAQLELKEHEDSKRDTQRDREPSLMPKWTRNNGLSAVHCAAMNGHWEILLSFIKGSKANLDCKTYRERFTPLILSAQNGHSECVALLVKEKSVNVNHTTSDHGYSALYCAAMNGHTEVVKLLLQAAKTTKGSKQSRVVNVNTASHTGETALFVAALHGHEGVVELLLGVKSILVNKAGISGRTPLFVASECGNVTLVELLLGAGADVNQATNKVKCTPLYIASKNGRAAVVELLLKAGANVALRVEENGSGWDALFVASQRGHAAVVRLLLEAGAKRTGTSRADHAGVPAGTTPLAAAEAEGHEAVAELLKSHLPPAAAPVSATKASRTPRQSRRS